MTNSKMLQFQSNVDDQEVLLNSKVDVSIKMNTYKITNLTTIRKCGMIAYANFKVKVNQLLALKRIVIIPTILYWVI
jgi:hypothetical protein